MAAHQSFPLRPQALRSYGLHTLAREPAHKFRRTNGRESSRSVRKHGTEQEEFEPPAPFGTMVFKTLFTALGNFDGLLRLQAV